MTAQLDLRDVGFAYNQRAFSKRRKVALSGINMTIGGAQPKITAIVGESGSGKTTLARLLLGLTRPNSGTVTLDDRPISDFRGRDMVEYRRRVQAVLQDPFDTFNPFYVVDHALSTPLKRLGIASSQSDILQRMQDALSSVGLRPNDVLGRYPHELSGGQRQRIMIARALLLKPDILIADEPVSMVDASMRAVILEILFKLKESGISIVYITHDLMTANQIADELVVLYGGRLMESGPAEQVIERPLHPYTQELIAAIPSINPDEDWNLDEQESRFQDRGPPNVTGRCRYLPYCTAATQRCQELDVPEVEVEKGRRLACLERA